MKLLSKVLITLLFALTQIAIANDRVMDEMYSSTVYVNNIPLRGDIAESLFIRVRMESPASRTIYDKINKKDISSLALEKDMNIDINGSELVDNLVKLYSYYLEKKSSGNGINVEIDENRRVTCIGFSKALQMRICVNNNDASVFSLMAIAK
jgi:hypothetical protein